MCGGKNERSLVCFLIRQRQRQRRHRSDACTVICSSSKTYFFPWIAIYQRVNIFVMMLAPRVTFF